MDRKFLYEYAVTVRGKIVRNVIVQEAQTKHTLAHINKKAFLWSFKLELETVLS